MKSKIQLKFFYFSVLLKICIRKLGFRVMYVAGYITFSLGAGFIALFPSTTAILVLSSVIGVMSATLYTIPYMLVAQYHEGYKVSTSIVKVVKALSQVTLKHSLFKYLSKQNLFCFSKYGNCSTKPHKLNCYKM